MDYVTARIIGDISWDAGVAGEVCKVVETGR
jgi:hypothetical protein